MKRYSNVTKRLSQGAENFRKKGAGCEANGRDYAPELVGGVIVVVGAALLRGPGTCAVEPARRHGPDHQAETAGVGMMNTPNHVFLAHLRERLPALGGVPALGERRPPPKTDDGARPEVERMLGKILDVGGGEIVEWLKEQEAKIAASPPCEQPEIGKLVATYYLPLLLDALALDDAEFNAEYPGEGTISAKQRAELAREIERHSPGCPRCSLKASSDKRWGEYVDQVAERKAADGDSHRFRLRV